MKTKTRRYRKLTQTEVREIRTLSKKGTSNATIAKRFKASQTSVWNVVNRKTHASIR